ncbi:CHASE2 domain-containing protein [Massilia yuzhufengensis]|uniref:Adenylate cyclase n=1 Tax=Massilia yuzhufengensis TaxID=1164594 RepID=A0A1I1VXB3_9BURK|nr:adenylate/guanylate cyclase domain-containing protein [Massilia yuzhufengensis]SFD85230.1 adenylate cyclase [Massilia yuzhufengensis]
MLAPRRRAVLARAAIAVAAVLLTVLAQWGPSLGVSLFGNATLTSAFFGNEILRDQFIRWNATTESEPRILVVDIDEASLAAVGPWPWTSTRIADLVEILLSRYEARGVALDIVREKAGDPEGDMRLAALASHGPLVLAQAFDFDHERKRPEPLLEGVLAGALPARQPRAYPADGHIANHGGFAGARNVGNIGFVPDRDGVLRHVPLVTRFGGQDYPALGLALVSCCSGAQAPDMPDADRIRIPFRRDWSAFTVVSATDILNEAIDPDSAKGRLVLVGSSSLGLGDRVVTPYAASRPGLGVQAEILSALLDRQQGKTPAPWPGRLVACVFALLSALLATFAFPRLPAAASVALLGVVSALWLWTAYTFAPHDPGFSTTAPLATNLFLLAVAVPYQWQLAQHRSRHLLGTLRQYVAPSVVQELLRSDLADPLAPRLLDVTTLIADMEGYTTQVESLSMEESATLTRDFLDCLTGPVIATLGTLDKYTGDGLVAFWGAPLPVEHHADLALDAAHAIIDRVDALSRRREALGHPPLRVRIGIESGPAVAGDFGTSFRSIYTAVGDSVNTASRLEQAAREFPHDVIVGAGTVERAQRHAFIALGERRLRGKGKLTALFTPAGIPHSRTAPLEFVGAAAVKGSS